MDTRRLIECLLTAGLCATSAASAHAQSGSQLAISAVFAGENKPVQRGLTWRVFKLEGEPEPRLVSQSTEDAPTFALSPGEYVVHVAYGLASSTRKVLIGQQTTTERVPLNAGVLSIRGSIADQPIPSNRLTVSVFIPSPGNSEGRLVKQGLRPGEVLRLPEGIYHVVSNYADSNSSVRADIRVSSGKMTEAEMRHRAATVILKLVSNPGGEARANTAWSVLTPGGDVIREALGAFPSVTLAEGDYVAIARNDGSIFQSEFRVRGGQDRDVEVLARNPTAAQPPGGAQINPPTPPRSPAQSN
jgi:hypothetical protein